MAPWVPIAILLCGLCGTVPAQEPPSPGQDDEATDLDAVVVTARKRTESVVEVPMNISVVGTSDSTTATRSPSWTSTAPSPAAPIRSGS